jgi:hypothetical protein
MAARQLVFTTLEEMRQSLRETNVIDVDNFDRVSNKRLELLFTECQEREAYLTYNAEMGQIIRVAYTAATLIRIPSEGLQLIEVEREYPNGKVVRHRKEWSVSETRKLKRPSTMLRKLRQMLDITQSEEGVETLVETAIRGLEEELGLIIDKSQLQFNDLPHGHESPIRKSSVYQGIWSCTHLQRFLLELPVCPWPGPVIVLRDSGTKIKLECESYAL